MLALDFTKGILILLMVLYHWINYFIGANSNGLRYLRFLTPSFIFITGFLISNVYLAKYNASDPALPKRLGWRGLKIFVLFILLNVFVGVLSIHPIHQAVFDPFAVKNLFSIYIVGSTTIAGVGKVASFFILIPISYLLLLSAFLIKVQDWLPRRVKRSKTIEVWGNHTVNGVVLVFSITLVLFLIGILVLYLIGNESSILELVSIGLFGVLVGHISIGKINQLSECRPALAGAYLGYVLGITLWNVVFPFQVIGVCLSVLLIYLLSTLLVQVEGMRRHFIILGQYSLLGYIGQLAIIQVLYQMIRPFSPGIGMLAGSLLAAFVITALLVEVADRVRRMSTMLDRAYRAVFA